MTIGAWIGVIIGIIILLSIGLYFGYQANDTSGMIIGGLIAIILSIGLFCGVRWYYTSTAAGSRALKTQQSNLQNGIKRRVEIYDVKGGLIKTYEGTFDVEYDNDRILFDDENGMRHIIYYPTANVIVDEIP